MSWSSTSQHQSSTSPDIYTLDNDSDSDLSDAPTNLEHMSIDFDDMTRESKSKTNVDCYSEESSCDSDDEVFSHSWRSTIAGRTGVTRRISTLERLPREILMQIGIHSSTDEDLCHLISACRKLFTVLQPRNADVWKERFLVLWDYPDVTGREQFFIAYRLRKLVLRNFIDFRNGRDDRLPVQLEVLKDMVLETYRPPTKPDKIAWGTTYPSDGRFSRNLVAFSNERNSLWMSKFLSAPFFNYGSEKYGTVDPLFDTLQLTLSHLVLSPSSSFAATIDNNRDRYDIKRIYNWTQKFSPLYRLVPAPVVLPLERGRKNRGRSPKFEELYNLDMHTFLHIRNFWHHHLLRNKSTVLEQLDYGEYLYRAMMKRVAQSGHSPLAWSAALQDRPIASESLGRYTWYGTYCCIHPWPKKEKDLEERQSCAEKWEKVDPMVLEFETSNTNGNRWSDIFHNIPAFQDTIPLAAVSKLPISYLRGMAPFLNLSFSTLDKQYTSKAGKEGAAAGQSKPDYHPYKALRLRGVMHAFQISGSKSRCSVNGSKEMGIPIPGFQRIVLVLYKPTTRFLVQVLEYDMGEYGSPWTIAVATEIAAEQAAANNNIATNATAASNNSEVDGDVAMTEAAIEPAVNNETTPANTLLMQSDPVQTERILRKYLDELLRSEQEEDLRDENGLRVLAPNADGIFDFVQHKVERFPKEKMTVDKIAAMEDRYMSSGSGKLEWEDIEYAYAYEGIVCPGGNVMMGRWWRMGLDGAGVNEGWELDCDGLGVKVEGGEGWVRRMDEDVGEDGIVEISAEQGEVRWKKSKKGLERGPFVFWT